MSSGNLLPPSLEDLQAAVQALQMANDELCRNNEELAASRQAVEVQCGQYQHLFELISDAYVVTDGEGTIQGANRAARLLFKARRDALEGQPLSLFVPERNRDVFNRRLAELEVSPQVHEWEEGLESSDGIEFPASLVLTVLSDSLDPVPALHWLIRDLTGSRQAARELQESEERYRVIFEHSPLGITHFDTDGNVVGCNRQFLNIVGAPKEKVIGFNMFRSLRDPAGIGTC
jgi:PAS domain S-box-containing protein